MVKVSVLMPVYNAAKYLKKAIDSILSQNYKDWELIIINDGSTDNSAEIVNGYTDERIRYLENPVNLGLIKTLNKGIDYCRGKYIARMDADDISLPDRLGRQVAFLDTHPDYLMCGTNAAVINDQDERIGKIRNFTDNNFLQIHLLFSVPFVHPSTMIRREVLQNNKYNEQYRHVEDYELWCRIARQGKIANLKKELFEYRWHDTNVSVVHNKTQEELKDKIILEQLKELDIYPTEEELQWHKTTFGLYSMGKRLSIPVENFEGIDTWFSKLIIHNGIKKIYNKPDLIAYLWSRWLVLCISRKKYSRMFSPSFASFYPSVLWRVFKLSLFLGNK